MHRIKKILLMAFLVSLGARLYVSFLVPGFIITFTAIILGLSLYFNEDIHPVTLGLTVAVISPGMRFIIESLTGGNLQILLVHVYPDIFFYIAYGFIFYFLKKVFRNQWTTKYYIILFLADFGSNFVEILVRTQLVHMKWSMIEGIFFVALGRTAIIILVIFMIVRYTSLIMRKEHEKRYHYLMMLSSRFKSEIYFLHKNMNQIESLMALSHNIKKQASDDANLQKLTLDLAKGVHEVKKDYMRVIQGLEEIYDSKMNLESLELKDLFQILSDNTDEYIKQKNVLVDTVFKCKAYVTVKDHFYLMSVLRNLINNGIDACGVEGKVYVFARKVDKKIEIFVRDTGHGIQDDDQSFIFNTGYSTKFHEETGDIYRGIGLTLVKDLVEQKFRGHLSYETAVDEGTSFIVAIDEAILEGGAQ